VALTVGDRVLQARSAMSFIVENEIDQRLYGVPLAAR